MSNKSLLIVLFSALLFCSGFGQYSCQNGEKSEPSTVTLQTPTTIDNPTPAPVTSKPSDKDSDSQSKSVKQLLAINIDSVRPHDNTSRFEQCYDFLLATRWQCWSNSAEEYDLDLVQVLGERDFHGHQKDCCALHVAEQCIEFTASFFAPCMAPEVQEYFGSIRFFYMNNGCLDYKPYLEEECKFNAAHTFRWSVILICIAFIVQLAF